MPKSRGQGDEYPGGRGKRKMGNLLACWRNSKSLRENTRGNKDI